MGVLTVYLYLLNHTLLVLSALLEDSLSTLEAEWVVNVLNSTAPVISPASVASRLWLELWKYWGNNWKKKWSQWYYSKKCLWWIYLCVLNERIQHQPIIIRIRVIGFGIRKPQLSYPSQTQPKISKSKYEAGTMTSLHKLTYYNYVIS